MDDLTGRLKELVRPLCEEQGIILIELLIAGVAKSKILKLTVDTEPGVTLQQCQMLSNAFSDLLFRKDLIRGDYRIEVSSPGVNKPLESEYEYRRSIDRDLKVVYNEGDIEKETIGKLLDYKDEKLLLQVKKETVEIPRTKIKKAVIKLKW